MFLLKVKKKKKIVKKKITNIKNMKDEFWEVSFYKHIIKT